jgi:hypothetical protein
MSTAVSNLIAGLFDCINAGAARVLLDTAHTERAGGDCLAGEFLVS